MSEFNPYAASYAVTDVSIAVPEKQALFYVVSKWKFLALFIGTFGLYLHPMGAGALLDLLFPHPV